MPPLILPARRGGSGEHMTLNEIMRAAEARLDAAGNIITEGDQVCLGGNDKYVGMCYRCYYERTHAAEK